MNNRSTVGANSHVFGDFVTTNKTSFIIIHTLIIQSGYPYCKTIFYDKILTKWILLNAQTAIVKHGMTG